MNPLEILPGPRFVENTHQIDDGLGTLNRGFQLSGLKRISFHQRDTTASLNIPVTMRIPGDDPALQAASHQSCSQMTAYETAPAQYRNAVNAHAPVLRPYSLNTTLKQY